MSGILYAEMTANDFVMQTCPLYGRWEIRLSVPNLHADIDHTLRLIWTHDTAPSVVTPCFQERPTEWRARFLPMATGTWHWKADFAKGSDPEISGQVLCRMPADHRRNPLLHHGPLHGWAASALTHNDGAPFTWRAEQGSFPLTSGTTLAWDAALFNMLAAGVTVLDCDLLREMSTEEGVSLFAGSNPAEIDPRFFNRIDSRIEMANDYCIVPAISLAGTEGLTAPQQSLLARALFERYHAHDVVFVAGTSQTGIALRSLASSYAENINYFPPIVD